jgi:NAD-dependent SIR2 family protein deacetylase
MADDGIPDSAKTQLPAPSAAVCEPRDATVAQALVTVEQLTAVYGFAADVADTAINAVGTDLPACITYILDEGLDTDRGGPVTPILTCPHIATHVSIGFDRLPSQPQATACTYHATQTPVAPTGGLKEEIRDDGTCPSQENWLCLECGVTRCSRYVNEHALAHWKYTQPDDNEGHCVAASLTDLSVWCHLCQAYLSPLNEHLRPIMEELEKRKFADEREEPERKKARSQDTSKEDSENEDASMSDHQESQDGHDESPGRGVALNLDDESDEESDPAAIRLLRAAAFEGIPLHWILQNLQEQSEGLPSYPFGTLPKSLKEVAEFIQSKKCQSIVVLAGAGMSVSAGIPDFRSADGLYATLDPNQLTATPLEREAMRRDPTVALDQTLFLQNPLPMLELQREFILGTHDRRWKATLAHRFVELLHAKTGKLVRLYTQNIDGLEDQCALLPRDKVIAVHGSMDRAECARCHTEADFDEFCDCIKRQIKDLSGQDASAPKQSTAIDCNICGYAAMKPSIVLFKSSLPRIFFENLPKDVESADILIIMGTSLRVAPANSLVWRVPRSSLRLLVNREPAGNHLGMSFDEDATRDYFAEGDCDDMLLELMEHLGWVNELKPLLENGQLPDACVEKLRMQLQKEAHSKIEENGHIEKS